jgi:general secretion pathway protein G
MNRYNRPRSVRTRRGFTLLELLLAMTIAGIVLAVALPVYNTITTQSESSSAINDIMKIDAAIQQYHMLNGEWPPTLADAINPVPKDPWGRDYIYLRLDPPPSGKGKNNKPRKDHNLHPINSDYDLYSVGEDGKTVAALTSANSHDDIVRGNNGAFFGLGKDY